MDYARELGLGPNSEEFLWEVIHKVDGEFLKMVSRKADDLRTQHTAQLQAKRSQPNG